MIKALFGGAKAFLGSWKLYALIGIVGAALVGTVWAQHQRVQNLKTQRDTIRQELIVTRDLMLQIEVEREELNERLLAREKERGLLYAEVNQLKNRIGELQDQEAVDWRSTPVPESIRMLLREGRVP